VQSIPPHKHASVFDVAPLVCVQSDAVMHRQKSELEVHNAVEVDSVLYLRKPLLVKKHPGGQFENDPSSAITSPRSMLVAAASHDALSKIGFRSLTDPQFVSPSSLG